ncbi:hypothetical protein [Helicobacter kayseriensis]|uniref:hypothetical protein n=1 Tax=Helicobacter kayseriensis TaxID=2905877 RepID=UPI001E59981F|nr:hypothetical protein [Helicobacter kayseriensis]MCE3047491.1 hypothetical protein [Helicobacter kayseriensis]MCE3048776.1 hypothetical protein [Helicobacter kayseriensis]
MKRFLILFILCLFGHCNDLCYLLEGASIIAQDDENTYLGKIENSLSSDSIFNEISNYGNPYSPTSIFNEYGIFGDSHSPCSANNSSSDTPPILIKKGSIIGFLTTNQSINGGINPNLLKALCKDFY